MSGYFEKEPAVVPGENENVFRWPTQRNAAKYERPGVISKVLPARLALLPDKLDGPELPEPSFRDLQVGRRGPKRVKREGGQSGGLAGPD